MNNTDQEQEQTFKEKMRTEGYQSVRKLPNNVWIAVGRMLYTSGLYVGLDATGFRGVYHYARHYDALIDASVWDGEGDPPGVWIKYKGSDGERFNPIPI